jgi:hypothetical protein
MAKIRAGRAGSQDTSCMKYPPQKTAQILHFPIWPLARGRGDERYSPRFPRIDDRPNVVPLFKRADGLYTLAELGRIPPSYQCRSKIKGSIFPPESSSSKFILDFFNGRPTSPVCVASFANERSDKQRFPTREYYGRDPAQIGKFVAKYDVPGRAVYFAVATAKPGKKRNKANADELLCLHADLDFKGLASTQCRCCRRSSISAVTDFTSISCSLKP